MLFKKDTLNVNDYIHTINFIHVYDYMLRILLYDNAYKYRTYHPEPNVLQRRCFEVDLYYDYAGHNDRDEPTILVVHDRNLHERQTTF